jgi:hypothetical protein
MLRIVVGVILIVVGAVFALQGANILKDSPVMSGEPRWIYIGVLVVLVGVVLLFSTFRRRRG